MLGSAGVRAVVNTSGLTGIMQDREVSGWRGVE